MINLQQTIKDIPFTSTTAMVRGGLIGYMTDIEEFSRFSPYDSLAEEGRTVKRILGRIYGLNTAVSQEAKMKEIIGLDAHTLCEERGQLAALPVESVLKVLALYGKGISDQGAKVLNGEYPLIEVTLAAVLGPKVPPDYTPSNYRDQLITDVGTDEKFFDDLHLYAASDAYNMVILDAKLLFLKNKYGLPWGSNCSIPVTPETRHYDRSMSPMSLWEIIKPVGYAQRTGTMPVVWNCKQV